MLRPNYIMINDQPVNRERTLIKIYIEIDEIKKKSPNVSYPPDLKNILLFCAKHNLWEVCPFISAETCFCIYKSWFEEIEKLTWQTKFTSASQETKYRTEFFFALCGCAGVKESTLEKFRKEAVRVTENHEPLNINKLLFKYEEKTLGERLPVIQRFLRYESD